MEQMTTIPGATTFGGAVRAIKKMTQKDNGPGLGRNYGETGVLYIRPKSWHFSKKSSDLVAGCM